MNLTPDIQEYIANVANGALMWGGFVGLLVGTMIGFTTCYILLVQQ